ncbi:hypothetical protein AWM75_06910 [Aerococcus urinaehominis]|uniref:Uncharacterized protein n=2 Tax=Aerococcus urinaehominis TaxID=128944 RepID=A0A109RI07_9LACT|nr:CvfD/Ygs/GSP13 family RNA-binding post-transcriptional regulator [Aerococcus urinaehominis]AMB99731.1 hypothetical protein AWM75_06910 [Aerococcus urinaehominis]SDL92237.1 general stress protein 13 [Aerococcus urinaehominis]
MQDKLTDVFHIGQIVEGVITGIQNYGVFVKIDDRYQALIHISEINHGFVSDLDKRFKLGDHVQAQVIDIDEYSDKMSLSLRSLQYAPSQVKKWKKRPRRRRPPQIGFKSLADKMPAWTNEALERIENSEERL